ncbi:MAG TPA: LPS export ABC transporter periplasmic protein LptC [Spirochaetia bacterium]|jgi:LPS export ABC transporter protein LptC|nr:LPS export ABC transporter periplasmic protein LptC [Spirochaetia bacterium]
MKGRGGWTKDNNSERSAEKRSPVPSRCASIVLLSCAISLFLSGCSLAYDELTATEEIPESIPDSVMRGFTHTTVRDGIPAFALSADEALSYSKKKRIYLSGITFTEFNAEGDAVTSGTARHAVFHTDTEDAEIEGDIYLYSITQEAAIRAASLYWDSEKRLLTGKPADEVRVTEDSGSEIKGKNFKGDLKTLTFTFDDAVSGKYIDDETD